MLDRNILELAEVYKEAMLAARDEGLFHGDMSFRNFPRGCCGETCYLLATFLKDYGIHTIYVWGDYGDQSHAWLVVDDDRVKQPKTQIFDPGADYRQLLSQYGNEIAGPVKITRYKARDLTYGLVIDITADQFGEPSVYVGKRNDFYRKFTFRDAHVCNGVENHRLADLYRTVLPFLPQD